MSTPVELGRVGRPSGVRGAVRLWPHNESSALLEVGRSLRLGANPGETRGFEIEEVRHDSNGVVVRLKGVTSRDAAGSLNGMMWFAERGEFPAPADGEYYHVDLIGLTARLDTGEALGRVADVWRMPASDMLVIRGEEELLVPFVEAFLVRVDLAAGEIVVRDVPGLRESQREAPRS